MLKYRAVKKQEVSDAIAEKHLNFQAVLDRSQRKEINRNIYAIVKDHPWLAAACLVFIFATLSYAIIKQVNLKKKKEQPVIKKVFYKKSNKIKLYTFVVPVNKSATINTSDELQLLINDGSLLAEKGDDSATIRISETFPLNLKKNKQGFSFFIEFTKSSQDVSTLPIEINLPSFSTKPHLLYGGYNLNKKAWNTYEEPKERLIDQPTKGMKKYNEYIQTLQFLDSIKANFSLKDSMYMQKKQKGFSYNKSFVRSLKNKKYAYENQKDFGTIVKEAQYEWELYNKQHHLEITKNASNIDTNSNIIKFKINEPGWYGVF